MTEMSTNPRHWNVGLVGYGEVGRILAEDLRKQDVKVTAYDLKLGSDQAGALRDHASAHGVALAASHADLAAQADFIVSAVTASQAVPVAQACAPAVKQGAWFLDFNSASPGAKRRAAALIDGNGGRYVEGAVMTSIPPYRIKVPLLLGGAGAAELAPLLVELGFDAKVASDRTRRRLGGQDVPQRDDQGPGGDGDRKFHHRAGLRRRGRGAGVAGGNLSRHRLGEAGRLFLPARDRTWPAPQRRGARGGGNRARDRPDAVVGARHRRTPGLGRRPRRRRPVRPERRASFARSPDWRTEADRILASIKPKEPRTEAEPMQFQKTPGWLDWYAGPSKPRFKLPAGAVDAHCHVFGPGAEFPFAPSANTRPAMLRSSSCIALRDHLGFARNVIVQATCHGADNRAMVDALMHSGGKARGVATVRRGVSDAELQAMHDAGVRGVRFNFVKRLVDFTPRDELMEIAGRIAKLGWHVVIYFEAVDLPELWDFFTALPTSSSSITWAGPTSASRSTGRSSSCS